MVQYAYHINNCGKPDFLFYLIRSWSYKWTWQLIKSFFLFQNRNRVIQIRDNPVYKILKIFFRITESLLKPTKFQTIAVRDSTAVYSNENFRFSETEIYIKLLDMK